MSLLLDSDNIVYSVEYFPQTVDYRVRSPRLQAKLCISGRRPRAESRVDSDYSGSDIDDIGADFSSRPLDAATSADDHSLLDASLASMRLSTSRRDGDAPPAPVLHASSKSVSRRPISPDYKSKTLLIGLVASLFLCDFQTSAFLFSKTSWPDARQILYQLVDIDVPEVVEMLAAPVTRGTCDSICGWMPTGYQKKIREIMTRYLEVWALGENTVLTSRKRHL